MQLQRLNAINLLLQKQTSSSSSEPPSIHRCKASTQTSCKSCNTTMTWPDTMEGEANRNQTSEADQRRWTAWSLNWKRRRPSLDRPALMQWWQRWWWEPGCRFRELGCKALVDGDGLGFWGTRPIWQNKSDTIACCHFGQFYVKFLSSRTPFPCSEYILWSNIVLNNIPLLW